MKITKKYWMVFVSFLPCFAEASSEEGCLQRMGSYFWSSPKISSEKIITELPPTNETVSSASGSPSFGETPLQMSPASSYERSRSSTTQSGSSGEDTEELPKSFESPQIRPSALDQSISPQVSKSLQFTQLPSQPVCTQPSPNQPLSGFRETASPVPSAYLSQSAPIQVGEIPQSQPVNPTLAAQPACPRVQTVQSTQINAGLSQQAPTPRVQPVNPTSAAQPTYPQVQTVQPTQILHYAGQTSYNQQASLGRGFTSTYANGVSIFVNTYDPTAMAQAQGALIQNNVAINSHDKTLAFLCEIVSKLYSRAIEHEPRENVIETIDPEAVKFIESYIRLREQDTFTESDQFTRYQHYFPRALWAKKNQPES